MTKTVEGKIQGSVIKYANKQGIRTIRMYFGPGIQTGWPDVLFLMPGGRPLFIEFKAPGKIPTPKQVAKIVLLEDFGYRVEVCSSVDSGKKFISAAFRGRTNAQGLIR